MKLRITASARRQVGEIIDFIGTDSPQRAATLLRGIDKSIDAICAHPELGKLLDSKSGRRRYNVPRSYHGLIYRLDAMHDEVVLLRVFGGRRDLKFKSR